MNGRPGIDAQAISIANGSVTLASGLELAYYDSKETNGEAPALVLLHGYCGSSSYWEQVAGELSRVARVIAPDARGHGLSAAPADEIYAMEAFAGDVEELLSRLGIDKAVMLGHSLGGYITLAYAERYGSRLAALGLIHSTPLPDSDAAKANRDKAVRAIEQEGVDAFVEGLIPKLFAADRIGELEAKVARGKEIGRATSQHGAAATARGMKERPDRSGVIRDAVLPVLIVAGAKDGVIPPASAFAAAGSRTTTVLLEQAGHMSMMECPDELVAAIIGFAGIVNGRE
ncbi:alpha/beta hydrolase [Paenibacillus sp. LHD-117]|uniref:alpha/beta fold hydrolase n=1 Tax=Paenibacillus sp. LHD-117 TaxID=3071412 RepID=UPI0027E13E11|nr:alpha/beta hydrolase [Paenibacillus sp. LHD-117]MDQ6420084.1 alpha/beta hydrolase [Paenibacillus sp. LHD-117]